MPAGLGFIVQAILGIMGYQSLLHTGLSFNGCVLWDPIVSCIL